MPSENLRVRIFDGHRELPSVAIEAMAQYLWRPYNQEDLEHVLVRRDKLGGFAHVNASVPLGAHSWLHVSAGAAYAQSYEVASQRSTVNVGRTYGNLIAPDASVSIDWRARRYLSLHATASYGATFVYSDNEPLKYQLAYGARIAPFVNFHNGFLRALRVELAGLVMYRRDARETVALITPILPYVYWQFQLW